MSETSTTLNGLKPCDARYVISITQIVGTTVISCTLCLVFQSIITIYVTYQLYFNRKHGPICLSLKIPMTIYHCTYLCFLINSFVSYGFWTLDSSVYAGASWESCIASYILFLPPLVYLFANITFWLNRLKIVFRHSIYEPSQRFVQIMTGSMILISLIGAVLILIFLIRYSNDVCYEKRYASDFMIDFTFNRENSLIITNIDDLTLYTCTIGGYDEAIYLRIYNMIGAVSVPLFAIIIAYQYIHKMYSFVKQQFSMYEEEYTISGHVNAPLEHSIASNDIINNKTICQKNAVTGNSGQIRSRQLEGSRQRKSSQSARVGVAKRNSKLMGDMITPPESPESSVNLKNSNENDPPTPFMITKQDTNLNMSTVEVDLKETQGEQDRERERERENRADRQDRQESRGGSPNLGGNGSDKVANEVFSNFGKGGVENNGDASSCTENEHDGTSNGRALKRSASVNYNYGKRSRVRTQNMTARERQLSMIKEMQKKEKAKLEKMKHELVTRSLVIGIMSICSTLIALVLWTLFDLQALSLVFFDGLLNGLAMCAVLTFGGWIYPLITFGECILCRKICKCSKIKEICISYCCDKHVHRGNLKNGSNLSSPSTKNEEYTETTLTFGRSKSVATTINNINHDNIHDSTPSTPNTNIYFKTNVELHKQSKNNCKHTAEVSIVNTTRDTGSKQKIGNNNGNRNRNKKRRRMIDSATVTATTVETSKIETKLGKDRLDIDKNSDYGTSGDDTYASATTDNEINCKTNDVDDDDVDVNVTDVDDYNYQYNSNSNASENGNINIDKIGAIALKSNSPSLSLSQLKFLAGDVGDCPDKLDHQESAL